MMEIFVSTLKQTLMITAYVLSVMVVIEYINVQSRNLWVDKLQHLLVQQISTAASDLIDSK
jgi:hypothetical protein